MLDATAVIVAFAAFSPSEKLILVRAEYTMARNDLVNIQIAYKSPPRHPRNEGADSSSLGGSVPNRLPVLQ